MRTITALILCTGLNLAAFGEEATYTLAKNGATDWHILTPEHCKGAELRAALELQKYLKEISGAELPITEVTHLNCMPEYDHEILLGWEYAVGASARVQALLKKYNVSINFQELGQDGYVIRTIGPQELHGASGRCEVCAGTGSDCAAAISLACICCAWSMK